MSVYKKIGSSVRSLVRKDDFYLISALIILTVCVLRPMLGSGYISDDILNSLTKGVVLENNQTVFGLTMDNVKHWLFYKGRFFPLSFYGYTLYYFVNNLFIYKAIILGLTLVDILVFGYFIKLVTKSRSLALFSILITPLFSSFGYIMTQF